MTGTSRRQTSIPEAFMKNQYRTGDLGPSPTLKMILLVKRIAMVVCLIIGLWVGVRVLMGMYNTIQDSGIQAPDTYRGRRGGAYGWMLVLGASVGAGAFVGMASYGLVVVSLKPVERKLLWSVYRSDGQSITRVATGLPYDEAQIRVAQLGNRELGVTFHAAPE
jgi:hypothetical protein